MGRADSQFSWPMFRLGSAVRGLEAAGREGLSAAGCGVAGVDGGRTALGATGDAGDECAGVDYQALQPAARWSCRASCTAATPSAIASRSESVLRSCTRRNAL